MSRAEGLVLAGHGSQRHPGSATPLHAHADRIRDAGRFDEVRTAFWKEEPPLRGVLATLSTDVAYVVPVLTSEGYFADEVFPRELGVAGNAAGPGRAASADGPEVRYAEPVGTHDAMTDVIAARVDGSIQGPPEAAGVALVGHGTERHDRSALSTVQHARRLRERGRYAEVTALFLDETPHVGELYDRLDAREVVVVPVFVADGYHTTRDVPEAIGHPGVDESATIDGRRVHYTGAVGTEPRLADVIVERAIEAGASARAESPDGGPSAAEEGLVAEVDSTPGALAWGELLLSDRPDGYEVCHRRDAGTPPEELESIDRPRDLRARARADDGDRYRPLSGARTLPSGWVLGGLDAAGLVRAVRFVYPGSIAHGWRERRRSLQATPFSETVARQTGIYADLEGFEGGALDAAVEAVCGDCVRRRCWDAAPDEEVDAPRGDGAIPCPEACPFLLSAAHAFDDADGVEPAGAEDPDVPAAAFEEPGNRYRVRFSRARARRTDGPPDDENAAAVPTGGDR